MECSNCHFNNPDGARFCSQCGTAIAAAPAVAATPEPAYAERRQLTVLFSDIVGSTELSERLDPEDLRRVLHDYQVACTSVIGLFDGYLAKYLGDGVLAYFGYPSAHEDDARRAIEAGLGIVEAIKEISNRYQREGGIPIEVRVGIHTGLVVVGDMDPKHALESNAIAGQTPNFAARVQSAAEPNSVLISAETNKLTRGYFESVDRGVHELKGISQAVRLYRIDHASTARSRLDAALGKLTPFAGRREETDTLHECWHLAQGGMGQIVLLGGEAGVGKSRLVHSLKEYASKEPDSWLTELRCSAFHQSSSFYPIIDFLERVVLRFEREETPQEKFQKIVGFASQYGLEPTEAVPLLSSLLSVPLSGDHIPLTDTPQRQKQMTIDMLVSILLHRSDRQPVLFVFEDLHWADPSSLELLDRLIDRCDKHHILSLLTFRPEFIPQWKQRPNLRAIDLRGVSEYDASDIILRVAQNKQLPAEVVEYIISKTDRIPLFLEELTKSVLESDALVDSGDHYELSRPFDTLGVPTTLQDSLTARLDRLADAKPVAQLAATIGREFSYEMLESIPGSHQRNMGAQLAKLVDAGIVYQRGLPPTAHYTFKHALIQDSAYSSLLKTSRKDYHKLIAEAIEAHSPGLIETQPELLAQHYGQAGVADKAAGYWLTAGVRALQRSANAEAISHLRHGIEIAEQISDEQARTGMLLQLYTMLGPGLIAVKGFGDANVGDTYEKAAKLTERMGSGVHTFLPKWGQALYALLRGKPTVCRDICQELLTIGQEANDVPLQIVAYAFLGNAEHWLGEFATSRDHLTNAIELYDPQKHAQYAYLYGQDIGVTAYCYRMLSNWCLGDIAASDADLKAAKELAASLKHQFSICWALDFAMTVQTWNEDHAATIAEADTLMAISQEQAYPFWVPLALAEKGSALSHLGDPANGVPLIQQGLAIWEMIGAILVAPLIIGWYTESLGAAGQYQEGVDAADKGIAQGIATSEHSSDSSLFRARGELLAKLGQSEAAETSLRKAIDIARSQSARSFELKAQASLYSFLRDTPQAKDTLAELNDLLSQFPKDIDKPFLHRVRALVADATA